MTTPASSPTEALTGSVAWLQSVLLGSVATIVAVLAVAAVGLLMLGGRLPVRRGTTVIIGCFILFSAAFIADGLLNAVGDRAPAALASTPSASPYTPAVPSAVSYDPYAGAAVPTQR